MDYTSIQWQNGLPYSSEYEDIYFNSQNGLKESEYVFLQGNHLAGRFAQLKANKPFIIAETGFGTGLNFLATLKLWRQLITDQAIKLHFISCEKHTLHKRDLIKSYKHWPELIKESSLLIDQYPEIFYEGAWQIKLASNVTLTLLIGDAKAQLSQLETQVDAWFLDGFAPAKNPQMWSDVLFSQIKRLSYEQTTIATFTAASRVKTLLQANGFIVKKRKGYGCKREMICASGLKQSHSQSNIKPYFSLPMHYHKSDKVAVIGAGIAGCSLAYELSQQGIEVDLYEAKDNICQAASGNPYGVLRPYLTADRNLSDQFHTKGLLYTRDYILKHANEIDFNACGALELLRDDKSIKRFKAMFTQRKIASTLARQLNPDQATKIAGIKIDKSAIYYPCAMMVNPRSLCQSLLKHASLTQVYLNYQLLQCQQEGEYWQLAFEIAQSKGEKEAKEIKKAKKMYQTVIFAGGYDLHQQVRLLNNYQVYPSQGQVSIVKSILNNQCILMDKGYLFPSMNNQQVLGASFRDNSDVTAEVRESEHQSNLEQFSSFIDPSQGVIVEGRVSTRCVTSDHMPLVGGVVDDQCYYSSYYSLMQKGTTLRKLPKTSYLPGVYMVSGFGSKGLSSSLISAKLISGLLLKHAPLDRMLYESVSPQRFKVREYKRRF